MYRDFPFTVREVAYLLNLRIRHKNAVSLSADCPFCGESKGKLNLNLKKTCSSPIYLAENPGDKTVFVTEEPLKGNLAYALSGRTFGCVPGANRYANLSPFQQAMKLTEICRELELSAKALT